MALPKGYVRSNDEIAEPFQPLPTGEKWTKQDLWDNRFGTVIRSGLYLKFRKTQSIEIDVIRQNLDKEIEERKSADESINVRLDKVEDEIANMEDWHEPLNKEVADREAGDALLQIQIDAEIETRSSQVESLQTQITKEISDRVDADKALETKLDKEIVDREAGDKALNDKIDAEIERSKEQDVAVNEKIDKEIQDRTEGVNANAEAIKTLHDSLGTAAFVNTGLEPGNVPVIEEDGLLNASIVPAVHSSNTYVVDSEEEMLALDAEVGDLAIRTDTSVTYVLKAMPPSVLDNWIPLSSPTDGVTSWNGMKGDVKYTPPVTSVNGKTGAVALTVNKKASDATGNFDVTGDTIPETTGSTVTVKGSLDKKVTLDTNQTITGGKVFAGAVTTKQIVAPNDPQAASSFGVRRVNADGTDGQLQYIIRTNPQLVETANGFTIGISAGANTILAGGEAHIALQKAIQTPETTPPQLSAVAATREHAIIVADSNTYIGTGYQNGSTAPTGGNWWTFTGDGKFLSPTGAEYLDSSSADGKYVKLGDAVTLGDDQTIKSTKTWGEIKTTGKGEEGQTTSIADDGAVTQIQKIAGSNEHTQIELAYGRAVVTRLQNDGTPVKAATFSENGVGLSTDRMYTNLTVDSGWDVNSAKVKTKNGLMIIHIAGARPKSTINGTDGGNIKTIATLPSYFASLLTGENENIEFMWSNFGGGQATFAGRIDSTGKITLYIMPTSATIVNGNRFSCYIPIMF